MESPPASLPSTRAADKPPTRAATQIASVVLSDSILSRIPQKFVCDHCKSVTHEQFRSDVCGHSLCTECMFEFQNVDEEVVHCPVCGAANAFTFDEELASEALTTIVSCPVAGTAGGIRCAWQGPVSDLHDHLAATCPAAPLACPHTENGCTHVLARAQLQAHAAECPFAPVACPHCGQTVLRRELALHAHTCGHRVVPCPCGCGDMFTLAGIVEHLKVEPKLVLPCPVPGCGEFVRAAMLKKHLEKPHTMALLQFTNAVIAARARFTAERKLLEKELAALDVAVGASEAELAALQAAAAAQRPSLEELEAARDLDRHTAVAFAKASLLETEIVGLARELAQGLAVRDAEIARLRAQLSEAELV